MSHRNNKDGTVAYCPACDAQIFFRRPPRRGENVTCRECESLLSVVRVSPIQLEWAFEDPFDDDDERFDPRDHEDYADERTYEDFDDYEYFDDDYD